MRINEPTRKLQFYAGKICWEYYNAQGELHRNDDKPAMVCQNGRKQWYQNGVLHRDGDKPASILQEGTELAWYQNGFLHRDGDKPAIEQEKYGFTLERKEWYQYGHRHREGGKPAYLRGDCKTWYENDQLIREEGCNVD